MPRQPRQPAEDRPIGIERRLRERIRYERERRRLTREDLAAACTRAGCPMDRSVVNKIETPDKDGRYRRINVDELAAFAAVFGVSEISELLRPLSEVRDERVRETAEQVISRMRELHEIGGQLGEDLEDLARLKRSEWEVYELVLADLATRSRPVAPADWAARIIDEAIRRLIDGAWSQEGADVVMEFRDDETGEPTMALLRFGSEEVSRDGVSRHPGADGRAWFGVHDNDSASSMGNPEKPVAGSARDDGEGDEHGER